VAEALRAAVLSASPAAARLAVVSAADPVDRATGRLIQLPDAPFLVGELDPVAILSPLVQGPVVVDNDVNWAARAARADSSDFAYLYLGEGLGCAIVSDGEVRRGSAGLAGEIAHLVTEGPRGRAVRFIDVFADLDLRRPGSTAIDVERLLARCADAVPGAQALRETLGRAVAGVVAAIGALADPEVVLVGGSWGPALLDAVRAGVAELPRGVRLRAAAVTDEPALAGARADALDRLRAAITAAP
jgi:predicted NBD/HSP70 family sugar kinase